VLQHLDQIYIPQNERELRRLQRRVEDLDRRVRAWAHHVLDFLPRGLMLIEDELYILGLFLAQQRRLNLELDAANPRPTLLGKLIRSIPFLQGQRDDPEILKAAHRTVAARLESDIDRACHFFCEDRGIPPQSDQAIDWRVAIRYLAQELHRLTGDLDLRHDFYQSPRRFETALACRDQAQEIIERRRRMLATSAHAHEEPSTA
jgi:hypothetical protein